MTNGHAAEVVMITTSLDEQKILAERAARMDQMRQQIEDEREKRRAIIAEVCRICVFVSLISKSGLYIGKTIER